MPPGKNMDDLWTILRSGMWRLWYKLSSEGKTRFYNEFLPLLHHTKHDIMGPRDDDSYYLVYLGSKPSARGKGYAKKLIEHMTARVCFNFLLFSSSMLITCKQADLENRATYLESSAHSNMTYYEKYGFEQKIDIQLVRGPKPIKLHIMVREPQPVAESSKGKSGQSVRVGTL